MQTARAVRATRKLSWLAVLALAACSPTREGYLRNRTLESAARGEITIVDQDVRLAVCGWRPAEQRFDIKRVSLTFTGEEKSGSGEADTTFIAPPGGSSAGFQCDGRVAFTYEFYPAGKAPAYFAIHGIHRVGPPAAFTTVVEEHASPLGLDTSTTATFGDRWKLPDGAYGSSYRVELKAAGRYEVSYGKKYPSYGAPRVIAYQKHEVVREGNKGGALGFWELAPGPAWFFLTFPTADTVDLRIIASSR